MASFGVFLNAIALWLSTGFGILPEVWNEHRLSDRSSSIHQDSTPVNRMEERRLLFDVYVPGASLVLYSCGGLLGYRELEISYDLYP